MVLSSVICNRNHTNFFQISSVICSHSLLSEVRDRGFFGFVLGHSQHPMYSMNIKEAR